MANPEDTVKRSILLTGVNIPTFVGHNEQLLDELRTNHKTVDFHLRGDVLTLTGAKNAVTRAESVVYEALEIAHAKSRPTGADITDLSDAATVSGKGKELAKPILTVRGKPIRPQTAGQREYSQRVADTTITFGVGPAGTGKTYLAIAHAVAALQAREISKIVLTRPAVEAGERLGYLPGRLEDKIDPYLRPLFDAIGSMVDPEAIPKMLESGTIEVAPLAYMRGRTLNESFVVLDEAQNTTPEQLKMFLTRLGYGSKMVITGDLTQTDLKGQQSGLRHAMRVLKDVEDVAQVRLSNDDIVRNSLVTRIVDAYDTAAPDAQEEK